MYTPTNRIIALESSDAPIISSIIRYRFIGFKTIGYNLADIFDVFITA